MRAHPDRLLATLGSPAPAIAVPAEVVRLPRSGAADCRIDLKLLAWRAQQAIGRNAAARARLKDFDPLQRPDLWAGTVQDGVARGFAVALEEAIALAPPEPSRAAPPDDPTRVQTFTGPQLRKKKDLLVESGGARVRFSRKEGVLLVDREAEVHSVNCLRFEARSDRGTLDGFVADESERPRLFTAQFLQPVRYVAGAGHTELLLEGRLGRGADGFDCSIAFRGNRDDARVRMAIRIVNQHSDHRLRARFLGVPATVVEHCCTHVGEQVENDAGGFLAFTLVRACGRLLVDQREVATPAAQCQGSIEHVFLLGLSQTANRPRG